MAATTNNNAWRLRTEGPLPWADQLVTGNPDKLFIVSADSHANEPGDFLTSRVTEPEYRDRLPRVEVDDDGVQWLITEGWEPQKVGIPPDRKDLMPEVEKYEPAEMTSSFSERMEAEDFMRLQRARTVEQRVEDNAADGIDAEIVFPNRGILTFATPDPIFAGVMTRAWNRWALDTFKDEFHRIMPMALIATGDLPSALKEIEWAAANGFSGFMLSNRPVFHRLDQPKSRLDYSSKSFDPLWALIQEIGRPIVFHVGNGEDPRAVRGAGAAIINFHETMATAISPIVSLIASGVFERFPKLQAGVIEARSSWIPWALSNMDHAYRAHHMWVRPGIPEVPSFYFKRNCFVSSLVEDSSMIGLLMSLGLEDNILWSSDYPHHEGTFPHSKIDIQRQLSDVTEAQRAKVLGENAVRIFGIDKEKVRASAVG